MFKTSLTQKRVLKESENRIIIEEIKNSSLFEDYLETNKEVINDQKILLDETLNNVLNEYGEKDLDGMPILSKRIIESINEELENQLMYRINDVFDNLSRNGEISIKIDYEDIIENIYQELKELI